jgi:hypothetical protein
MRHLRPSIDTCQEDQKKDAHAKTYDSQDSLMVTHLTTDWPVTSLDRAERTGRLVLWYV